MNLSIGNMMYLGLVVAGFSFFVGMLSITAWRCNGPFAKDRKPVPELEPPKPADHSLKVHGDKLSHTLDAAA